jgi:hypothetical protein
MPPSTRRRQSDADDRQKAGAPINDIRLITGTPNWGILLRHFRENYDRH